MLILRNLDPRDLGKLLIEAAETYAGQKTAKAGDRQILSPPSEACSHSRQSQADMDCSRYE